MKNAQYSMLNESIESLLSPAPRQTQLCETKALRIEH
jgi:hypothetical protein